MPDKDKRAEYLQVDPPRDEMVPRARTRINRMKTVLQKKYGTLAGLTLEHDLYRQARSMGNRMEYLNTKLTVHVGVQRRAEELHKEKGGMGAMVARLAEEFTEMNTELVYCQWAIGQIYTAFVEQVGETIVGIR